LGTGAPLSRLLTGGEKKIYINIRKRNILFLPTLEIAVSRQVEAVFFDKYNAGEVAVYT